MEMDQQILDMRTTNTRENWLNIIVVMENLYGVWTAYKGNRNYLAMSLIPVFTSRETVNSGINAIQKLQKERNGWGRVGAHLYDDSFYRPWLLERMREWPQLHWLKNSFEATPSLTFTSMKMQLLASMQRLKNEEQQIGQQLAQAVSMQLGKGPPAQSGRSDSTGGYYNAHSAAFNAIEDKVRDMQDQMAALAATQQRQPTEERKMPFSMQDIQCNNCRKFGHISRWCPSGRRQVAKYGDTQQQRQQSSYGPGTRQPSFRPHPQATLPVNIGSKRTFQPGPAPVNQHPSKMARFDPTMARYPERGTGPAAQRSYRGSAAIGDVEYDIAQDEDLREDHYTMAAAQAVAMWEQQEEDKRLPDEDFV